MTIGVSHILRDGLFLQENQQAEQLIEQDNLPDAAQILVDIVEKDPHNWNAYNNMGILSWKQKAWNDAYDSFLSACHFKPDFADALVNLFDAALKLRKIEEVIPVFEKAVRTDPVNADIKLLHDTIKTEGEHIYKTKRALLVGKYNSIIEEADRYLEAGDLKKAMERYLLVNDTDGPDADAYTGLGIISFYEKKYRDAFTLFFEAIKLNPMRGDNFINLMDCSSEIGMHEEAKKIFETYYKEIDELEEIESEIARLYELAKNKTTSSW